VGEDKGRILIVDDELAIRLTVREILRRAGFSVSAVASGEEALDLVQSQSFDLALIDLVMPGMGGIELMRRLQEVAPDTMLIVMTARGSMETAIEALRLGAHDYLIKPCDDKLLKQCIETGLTKRREKLHRRQLVGAMSAAALELAEESTAPTPAAAESKYIHLGNLVVDVTGYTATLAGRVLDLTPTEFDLLVALARAAGRALSHRELVQAIRGYEAEDWEAREIARYHVHGLRSKLGDADYVKTVRGVGYRLVAPKDAAPPT
jgi:two-component system alkaline phosphatase synthesis response regulator PhoP